jgi:hypothetical protein
MPDARYWRLDDRRLQARQKVIEHRESGNEYQDGVCNQTSIGMIDAVRFDKTPN